MNTNTRRANGSEVLAEYDFSNAVRGKYYESYRQGTNVVLLDADVAEVLPSAAALNDALDSSSRRRTRRHRADPWSPR